MYLFFDTETTGLPDYKSPVDAESQPHIVQLACILTDESGNEKHCVNVIVNPGVEIPEGAARVHGISTAATQEFGISPVHASSIFRSLSRFENIKYVAHNIQFDSFLTDTMFMRYLKESSNISEREQICTAELSKPILQIPPTERMLAAGFNGYKTPNLSEAHKHFFGVEVIGAHDALNDVRACKNIFFAIKEQKEAA